MYEINKITKSLKNTTLYGYNEIPIKILKLSAPFIISPLTHICDKSLSPGVFLKRLIILYIKMKWFFVRFCLFVSMYGTCTNSHFWTDLNHTLHMPPPWSGRDRRVWLGPKFLTFSTFWALFSLGVTAESWAQDGCRRNRFPRYPYIRGSSWCTRDVTDITLSQTAESSAAALYPWFQREFS